MPRPNISLLFRVGSVLALVLVLAGCTKGGQFDPTEIFNSDAFDSKKKLKGDRELVFPNGVPGTTTGVPPDLVKGYQPPPEQADSALPAAPAVAAAVPKAKPKPKPKLATTPAQRQDSIWSQQAATSKPTRINVGPTPAVPAAQPAAAAQALSSQAPWPGRPQSAPAQQTAQPSQSIWPNPPAPATSSQ